MHEVLILRHVQHKMKALTEQDFLNNEIYLQYAIWELLRSARRFLKSKFWLP